MHCAHHRVRIPTLYCDWQPLQQVVGGLLIPVTRATRPPSSLTNVIDFGPRTPVVSMAIGVKQCSEPRLVYLASFLSSAPAATSPASEVKKLKVWPATVYSILRLTMCKRASWKPGDAPTCLCTCTRHAVSKLREITYWFINKEKGPGGNRTHVI